MSIKVTKEYEDVLCYMGEVLGTEFPTSEYTPEYLILSILDNVKCHANIIMDNTLMSDTMEYLRVYYTDAIRSMKKKPIMNDDRKYNNELKSIIESAVEEAKIHDSKFIGTEHVIMALLNPEFVFKSAIKLIECGLKYEYVEGKSSEFVDKTEKQEVTKNYINNNSNNATSNKIPLKSEINSRNFVANGSTPNIDKYTINLHEEIEKGHYDRLIGRDEILKTIIQVLSRRKKNNVILVGKPGVGRTSIGYKLAEMIDSGNVPDVLEGKQVIMLDVMALVSGTHLRGMFEERVDGLFKELKNNPNYILFIDDMQNVVRNGGREKDGDLTDVIGSILTEGDVRVIGTISFKDYRNGIEANSTLSTKLQKIIIEPSTKEETYEILKVNKCYYENFHHVKFPDNVLYKAIDLAKRYITNNNLPDSALDVIDLTGASISLTNKQEKSIKQLKKKLSGLDEDKKIAMNSGNFEKLDKIDKEESIINKQLNDLKKNIDNDSSTWLNVTEDDVSDTVSSMTNIPVSRLKLSDKENIMHIEDTLKKYVVGQDEAIADIARAIKRSRAGFGDKSKVMATFMMISGTGCGKTLIAKKLAENVFGSEDCLVRFDMSEYQDKTSINKLIGSNAGYVGYENGGLLTEAIKNKPYCVLLFDEIEKADESVYNLFLQLFDDGRLTDNNGTTVNFKNVIVIMTSNVGARKASELGGGIGFMKDSESNKRAILEKALKQKFNPEFLNRIDKIIQMNPLTDENIHSIVSLELDKVCARVQENNIILKYDDKVVEYVFNKAIKQKEYGARPIMRIIQDDISDKVVDLVLQSNKHESVYNVTVDEEGKIKAEVGKN